MILVAATFVAGCGGHKAASISELQPGFAANAEQKQSEKLVVSQLWAQTDIESKLMLLVYYHHRAENYLKDFKALGNVQTNRHNETEALTTMMLVVAAGDTMNYLRTVGDLLVVYKKITQNADREAVKPTIKSSFDANIESIGRSMKQVDVALSLTKSPAIAASATALKQDLREIKTLLESIVDLP
jgi:hypothetical protein